MNFIITQNGVLNLMDGNILQAKSIHQVYEVIRVVGGIALFLEDHFERLLSSVQISGLQFEMEFSEFKNHMTELIQLNQQQNGNVKFILSEEGKEYHWSFSFIPHNYPGKDEYQKGVSTGLLLAERENPNAKVFQNKVNAKARQLMEDKELYEVLLVNRNGMITEGSRSNVFFVKGNIFYTAPASMVLVGVTRKKVMECLDDLNFKVIEEAVSTSEIATFDAVFLTGTSPKVLAVNGINNILFRPDNSFVIKLMERYDLMIETYVKAHLA